MLNSIFRSSLFWTHFVILCTSILGELNAKEIFKKYRLISPQWIYTRLKISRGRGLDGGGAGVKKIFDFNIRSYGRNVKSMGKAQKRQRQNLDWMVYLNWYTIRESVARGPTPRESLRPQLCGQKWIQFLGTKIENSIFRKKLLWTAERPLNGLKMVKNQVCDIFEPKTFFVILAVEHGIRWLEKWVLLLTKRTSWEQLGGSYRLKIFCDRVVANYLAMFRKRF